VLVMWEDGCVMSQRPAHNAEASTSCATPPTSDVATAQLEQELHRSRAPHAPLDEA
jgi:hypothetical protein